jgi:hypothetical protein
MSKQSKPKTIRVDHRQGMGHDFYRADFRTGAHKNRKDKRQETRKQQNDRHVTDEG